MLIDREMKLQQMHRHNDEISSYREDYFNLQDELAKLKYEHAVKLFYLIYRC